MLRRQEGLGIDVGTMAIDGLAAITNDAVPKVTISPSSLFAGFAGFCGVSLYEKDLK